METIESKGELDLPRMAERVLWPVQMVAECPKCCKELTCQPAPAPKVLKPNEPPPPPMYALTCDAEGCGYTFITPQQFPIVDFRSTKPHSWDEVLKPRSGRRCASCRVLAPTKAAAKHWHKWPDGSMTCEKCGGPEPVPV